MLRNALVQEYGYLQVFFELQKPPAKPRTSLIRKRSLVRVQAGPPTEPFYLRGMGRECAEGRDVSRPSLTPTRSKSGDRVLRGRERVLHGARGLVADAGHHV